MVTFLMRWLEILVYGVFAYRETGSAFIVAMLIMVRVLPMGLFGAAFGVVAERIVRRHALILSMIGLLISAVTLCLISFGGELQVWHLAAGSFVNGVVWAADNPVRRAMMGDVVGAERMDRAMSIEVGTSNATRLAGPSIGGLLLAYTGIQGAFALAVALYLVGLWAAVSVRARNTPAMGGRPALSRMIASAWRELRKDSRFTGLLWLTLLFNLFAWPVLSLVPVIAHDQLGLAADGIGFLASMDGFGALVFAFVLLRISRPDRHGKIYTTGLLVFLLALPLFALAKSVWLASLALFLVGCGQAGFAVMQATITYAVAPPDRRSQAMGIMTMCIGVGPIGFILTGLLAEYTTATATALICSCTGVLIIALSWPWWRPTWQNRRL
jgi:MFS family permease